MKYVSLDVTGSIIHLCMDQNFVDMSFTHGSVFSNIYEGHLESKERFAIKKYLLIIGKKKNMQVFNHTPSPTSPHSHLGH